MKNYTNFDEYLEKVNVLTEEEKDEILLKAKIVSEIVNARHNKGLTQQELAQISGVRQPIIARLEKDKTDAQLSTILKILSSLGLTLSIVAKDEDLRHQKA